MSFELDKSGFEFRPARVLISGALEHAGDAQQLLLLERGGEDLQTNRQSRLRETEDLREDLRGRESNRM